MDGIDFRICTKFRPEPPPIPIISPPATTYPATPTQHEKTMREEEYRRSLSSFISTMEGFAHPPSERLQQLVVAAASDEAEESNDGDTTNDDNDDTNDDVITANNNDDVIGANFGDVGANDISVIIGTDNADDGDDGEQQIATAAAAESPSIVEEEEEHDNKPQQLDPLDVAQDSWTMRHGEVTDEESGIVLAAPTDRVGGGGSSVEWMVPSPEPIDRYRPASGEEDDEEKAEDEEETSAESVSNRIVSTSPNPPPSYSRPIPQLTIDSSCRDSAAAVDYRHNIDSFNAVHVPLDADRSMSLPSRSSSVGGGGFFARPRLARYLFATSACLVVCSLGLAATGLGMMYNAKQTEQKRAIENEENQNGMDELQFLPPSDVEDEESSTHDADAVLEDDTRPKPSVVTVIGTGVESTGANGPKGQLTEEPTKKPKGRLTEIPTGGPTGNPIEIIIAEDFDGDNDEDEEEEDPNVAPDAATTTSATSPVEAAGVTEGTDAAAGATATTDAATDSASTIAASTTASTMTSAPPLVEAAFTEGADAAAGDLATDAASMTATTATTTITTTNKDTDDSPHIYIPGDLHNAKLLPVADTWLEYNDTKAYGIRKRLKVDGRPERVSLLKFNTTALLTRLRGEDVVGASLRLYALADSPYGGKIDLLGGACDDWDEYEVSWTNAPECLLQGRTNGEEAAGEFGAVEVANAWAEAVLELNLRGGALLPELITLRVTSGVDDGITYASREAEGFSPELVVYYTLPKATPELEEAEFSLPEESAEEDSPTDAPTEGPTVEKVPTASPIVSPTRDPSGSPTYNPTRPWPSYNPTIPPTTNGTISPTASPSATPRALTAIVSQDAMVRGGDMSDRAYGSDAYLALRGSNRRAILEFDLRDRDLQPGFDYAYSLRIFVTYVAEAVSRSVLVTRVTDPEFEWDEETVTWNEFGEPEEAEVGWFSIFDSDVETLVEIPLGRLPVVDGRIVLILENIVEEGMKMGDAKFDFRSKEFGSMFPDVMEEHPPTLIGVPQLEN